MRAPRGHLGAAITIRMLWERDGHCPRACRGLLPLTCPNSSRPTSRLQPRWARALAPSSRRRRPLRLPQQAGHPQQLGAMAWRTCCASPRWGQVSWVRSVLQGAHKGLRILQTFGQAGSLSFGPDRPAWEQKNVSVVISLNPTFLIRTPCIGAWGQGSSADALAGASCAPFRAVQLGVQQDMYIWSFGVLRGRLRAGDLRGVRLLDLGTSTS